MTPQTYAAWLGWAVSELGRAGVDGPRLDAKILLLKAAGIDSAELIMKSDAILPADIAGDFQAMISRRMAGEPVSLILGEVEFMGLTFRTDARALAPRQDSERLVELALERAVLKHPRLRAEYVSRPGTRPFLWSTTLYCKGAAGDDAS